MKSFPSRFFPSNKDQRWIPLIWLPWFAFFILQPALDHTSAKIWLADGLGGALFLFFFFAMFWDSRARSRFYLAGIVLLGLGFAPINPGAATFFIYGCSFAPFLVETESGALKVIALIVGLAGLETWLLHLSVMFFVYAGGFALVIGAGNIFFAQRNRANETLRMAREEIEHLAKVAERERIARDLHDVLGHTLSVIILKSELAGKLIDRDPGRAKAEIREVEQISRQALSEVRDAIRGYRSQGLAAELAQAKSTLETAGVAVRCGGAKGALPPLHESVLSMAVREAVTNVVRHAHAHTCSLRLEQHHGSCRLEVEDDGRGGFPGEGNGLRGMRERVEMLGGSLHRDSQAGTRITITLPLQEVTPKAEGCTD